MTECGKLTERSYCSFSITDQLPYQYVFYILHSYSGITMLIEMSSWKIVRPIDELSMEYDSYLTTGYTNNRYILVTHNRQKWHA